VSVGHLQKVVLLDVESVLDHGWFLEVEDQVDVVFEQTRVFLEEVQELLVLALFTPDQHAL